MAWHRARVAPLWTDLTPEPGGVTVTETCVVVVDCDASGTSWNGVVSTRDVLAGISPGRGAVLVPVDLSTNSGPVAGRKDALFECFSSTSFSLSNIRWDLDAAFFGFTPTGGG